jgi:hypothetical protein
MLTFDEQRQLTLEQAQVYCDWVLNYYPRGPRPSMDDDTYLDGDYAMRDGRRAHEWGE